MKPRTLLIVLGVILVVGVGFALFRLPQPLIEIAPERIFSIGGFTVTNTILTSWVMIAVISIGLILGTRRLTMVPRGFQNLFEAVMEGFGNLVESIAGQKNGRRFFPVVFILLLYIVLCNWAALTPLFNQIGIVENEAEHIRHEAHEHPDEVVHENETLHGYVLKTNGISFIPLFTNTKLIEVEIPEGTTFAQRERIMEEHLAEELDRPVPPEGQTALRENETYGFIAPFLRGVNSDLNAPLSYALWSAIFVEFWGITTLGLLKYGSKFLNFKGGPIGIFVGLLELISEFARIISFTFRLFGNIFAGEVLLFMMSFLVPFLLVDVFYMLELFVGLVQAFVFAMLTLVFGVMAVTSHDDHDAHAPEAHGAAHGEAVAHGAAHA